MSDEVKETSINNVLRYMKTQMKMWGPEHTDKFWAAFDVAFGDDFDQWFIRTHEDL